MSTHFLLLTPLWPPSMYLCFKKDLMRFIPYLLRMSMNWFLPCSRLKNFLSHTWQHWARMTRRRHIELLYSPGQLLVALRYLESSNFVHVWPHSTDKILWLMPALDVGTRPLPCAEELGVEIENMDWLCSHGCLILDPLPRGFRRLPKFRSGIFGLGGAEGGCGSFRVSSRGSWSRKYPR